MTCCLLFERDEAQGPFSLFCVGSHSIISSVIYSSRRVSHIINIPSGNAKHYGWNIVQRTAPATMELRECFRCKYPIIVVLILINVPVLLRDRIGLFFSGKLFFFKIISSVNSDIRIEFFNNLLGFYSWTTTKVSKHFFPSWQRPICLASIMQKGPKGVGNLVRNERIREQTLLMFFK